MSKAREEALAKLLRLTWEALPAVLAEGEEREMDIQALARIAGAVRIALDGKRVRRHTFAAHMRSIRAKKGWDTRRSRPLLRVVGESAEKAMARRGR